MLRKTRLSNRFKSSSGSISYRQSFQRKLFSLLIIAILFMWPGPSLAILHFISALSTSWAMPVVNSHTEEARQETIEERLASVASIRITPPKFVGYENQSLMVTAEGLNRYEETVQGAVFSWESSDSSKVQIDESGRAVFIKPGYATITCRAGTAEATMSLLIRPGRRASQTDAQWEEDQKGIGDSNSTASKITPSLLERLSPVVLAQSSSSSPDVAFNEMWSEPRNLIGTPTNSAIEGTSLGLVIPESNNFGFTVPIEGLSGRGGEVKLNLRYNSRVWFRHGNSITFNPITGWPSVGFSFGFGRIVTYGTAADTKYVLIAADGTRHYLGSGNSSTSATYHTKDGSRITYVGNATQGGRLYYADGTRVFIDVYNNRLLPTQISDSNGNYTRIVYKYGFSNPLAIDYVMDTKGRTVKFNYDASGKLISITAPGLGGTSQTPVTRTVAQFDYESRQLSYNFVGLNVENAPAGSIETLKHIYFPATQTGYLFNYSDYGMIHTVSGRRQMSVDANGVISDGVESASVTFDYPTSGGTALADTPAFTQRSESPGGVYNYSSNLDPVAMTASYSILRPDGTTLKLTRSTDPVSPANGRLVESEILQGGTTYSKRLRDYATIADGSTELSSVISQDETGAATKMDFDYDLYGNVTNRREYGFKVNGAWQVRRRTNFTYKTDQSYIDNYLRNLVTEIKIYDGRENNVDSDDVVIAKTAYTYDDYAQTGGMLEYYNWQKAAGHSTGYGPSVTVRGNVTATSEWADLQSTPSRIRRARYDIFGNVVENQLSCCKQKTYNYVETDYWSDPYEIKTGDPSGVNITDRFVYDFNTGLPTSYLDPFTGKKKGSFSYDAALRPTLVNVPGNPLETRVYDDSLMKSSITRAGMGTTTHIFDGWGRTVVTKNPAGGQVDLTYDEMGRVRKKTNPFLAGSQPGPETVYEYDPLGLVKLATLPDGNTIQTIYSGPTVTSIDQVGRITKSETDGLGRQVKVTEQDQSGALSQETTYKYDLLNNLTEVNQGGQIRAYKYDSLSQLIYERIPEQNATIADPSGQMWSTKHGYTDFGALASSKDARGVLTKYSYDSLRRLKYIEYNLLSAPGVAATPYVTFTYDTSQTSNTNGLLLSVSTGDYQESYTYNTARRLTSVTRTIDGKPYTISYGYNTNWQRSSMTYPSLRSLNFNYDTAGRVKTITSAAKTYLTVSGYNSAGYMTGLTLGNGVAETYNYDPLRLQMTAQSASVAGTPLLNLNYNYQAQAGQMGAGSQTGNVDSLTSVSGNIGGQPESATYSYDLLGRLAISTQAQNGVSVGRQFSYDRWGNRTAVADTNNGGAQLQSASLATSGGVPTNRINVITNGTTNAQYSYDAAGNVTSDGQHTYQYDGENRLISVDQGAGGQYGYDHHNRRVKKTLGTSTVHYVWEGTQQLAEYDAGTGAAIGEYIYSGSRMIAKEAGGATEYYLSDRLSKRLVMDSSGTIVGRQSHLPFGEEFATSGLGQEHKFNTYERDGETGLDYALNRNYSPSAGRFMQFDPYRGSSNSSDPQSWNRYSYVRNDPVNRVDPLGLDDTSAPPPGGSSPPPPSVPPESINVPAGAGFPPIPPGVVITQPGVPSYDFTGTSGGSSGSGTSSTPQPDDPKNKPCPETPDRPRDTSTVAGNILETRAEKEKVIARHGGRYDAIAFAELAEWLYQKVRNKGPWDYKQQGPQYADYGNFNFGAVARELGLNKTQALRLAGWAQVKAGTSRPSWGTPGSLFEIFTNADTGTRSYGDDPKDAKQIKRGIKYTNRKCAERSGGV